MKFSEVLNNVKNNKLYSLMAVLGFSVIVYFIVYIILTLREHDKPEDSPFLNGINLCPDGWIQDSNTEEEHKCKVPDSKISTTFNKGFTKDFGQPIYKNKPEAMCKWANYHNVPWIGIDHLCLKNQN